MSEIITQDHLTTENRKQQKFAFSEVNETPDTLGSFQDYSLLPNVTFAPKKSVVDAILKYSRKK